MQDTEKSSRRKQCILDAVGAALQDVDYRSLTIEEIASRAGVGKSTIYRWWKDKSDLVFDAFKQHTQHIFEPNFEQSVAENLEQQLLKLVSALHHALGRALLVVIVENRATAVAFFQHYLLPRREYTYKLIALAIERQEIQPDYPFDLMLDALYGAIHYQIVFFNQIPDEHYIRQLVALNLAPLYLSEQTATLLSKKD